MNEISTDVRVIIDPETMNVTSGGDVTGLLYLRFRDTFFPREGWLDFPELVLHAWLSSLLVILFQVDNVAMFRFLEGPPVLWGRVLGGGGIALQGLHSEKGRRTNCFVVRIGDFTRALLIATDEVVKLARLHHWESDATGRLADVAKLVQKRNDLAVWDSDPSPAVPDDLTYGADSGLPVVPTQAEIRVDMEHIMSCHGIAGSRATPGKSLFPAHMDERQIEDAIRRAYDVGDLSWPDAVHLRVTGTGGGLDLEMWVNPATKTIETAHPFHLDDDNEEDTNRC